jgi:hypothetical protein
MKKAIFFTIFSLFISIFSFGQTSIEHFETESIGSPNFTDNGVVFNILSHTGTFDINTFNNGGWTGTAVDQKFIDNSGSIQPNVSFSVKTTSNLFKVNRFWLFCGDQYTNPNITGSITVSGILGGVTKFSQTKSDGFRLVTQFDNGYTLIDLTNLNGNNYSNIIIDQLKITASGDIRYLALDAMTWVKDSNVVLATDEIKSSKKEPSIYPNPTNGPLTIKAEDNTKFNVYSQSGQLVKTVEAQKGINETDISELPKGVYIVKSSTESYKVIKK